MKTPETRFSYIPSLDADLFAVRAGIPLATAAEEAGCIVDAALGTVRRVAGSISIDDGAHLLWSAVYSLDMAHGLLGSIQAALEDLEPAPANDTPKATEPESVCDLLTDLDWYLSPSQHRALRRLADERYEGNLKLALAGLFEGALEELEGTTR